MGQRSEMGRSQVAANWEALIAVVRAKDSNVVEQVIYIILDEKHRHWQTCRYNPRRRS